MHLTQVAQAVVVRPWLIIPARCWSFAIGSWMKVSSASTISGQRSGLVVPQAKPETGDASERPSSDARRKALRRVFGTRFCPGCRSKRPGTCQQSSQRSGPAAGVGAGELPHSVLCCADCAIGVVRPGRERVEGASSRQPLHRGRTAQAPRGAARRIGVLAPRAMADAPGFRSWPPVPKASGRRSPPRLARPPVRTDVSTGSRTRPAGLSPRIARASAVLAPVAAGQPRRDAAKRWLLGTHQGAVSVTHIDYYLDEYTFRFNRRTSRSRGLLFLRLMQQAVDLRPLPAKEIRAGRSPDPDQQLERTYKCIALKVFSRPLLVLEQAGPTASARTGLAPTSVRRRYFAVIQKL